MTELDVSARRSRSKTRKVLRAIAVIGLFDFLLWRTGPWHLPSLGASAIVFLPVLLLAGLIGVMLAMPLFSGRSPHQLVYPEQIETGLSDVVGLDSQVKEVQDTMATFMEYATFRQAGGTPRRGILFEGRPGTGKTYLAKAMAKEAGVPFLFAPAPSFQSMWYGMTAFKVRSFFRKLRKTARREGGAIGFIEEFDALGASRTLDGMTGSRVEQFTSPGGTGMVNELLVQMQSFDQPSFPRRAKRRVVGWVNSYLPDRWQVPNGKPEYVNILLVAATNRAEALDRALLRPGRFDRRLYFDEPSRKERRALLQFFFVRKACEPVMLTAPTLDLLSAETLGMTPVMIEHVLDEALLIAIRAGRTRMSLDDVTQARFHELGTKQPTLYTEFDRRVIALHEAGHAVVAYYLAPDRKLDLLSIIKRGWTLGMLAHSPTEERNVRTEGEYRGDIAVSMAGQAAERMFLGDTTGGPSADLRHATRLAAWMVGAAGMGHTPVSIAAGKKGTFGGDLTDTVLRDNNGMEAVEKILREESTRASDCIREHSRAHEALTNALIERDELVREEIENIIQEAEDGYD